MKLHTRRRVLLMAGVGGAAGLAGCGKTPNEPDGTSSPDTSSPTESPTETPTETPTPSPPTDQAAKLVPSDGDSGDQFGWSVAVSDDGTTAIVGARWDEDPNGDHGGSAYVFSRSDGSWTQQAKLLPDEGDSYDEFGFSVAMSGGGTTAIVGARRFSDPNEDPAGSAYVFSRSDGSWTQQAKLLPDEGLSGDLFGCSVAVSGDGETAIVGARDDDTQTGVETGSAYVFSRGGGSWSQQAKLVPDDGDSGDRFGFSVATSGGGGTVIIGANYDNEGSAYVFSRGGGSWHQQAKLVPADGDSGDRFGYSVAVSGDGTTAIVGARHDDDPYGHESGSAYVFSEGGGSWPQQAKLTAADGASGDKFGFSVAVSDDGTNAIVGARWWEGPNGERPGSAYVFSRGDGSWQQQAKLTAVDGDNDDALGCSAAVSSDGTTAITGARYDDDPNGERAGSAYVFE